MLKFDLAAMWKRAVRPRRTSVLIRPISAPATLASDLYAAAYKPVIALWTEALPPILAEYERTLAAMQTDSPASVSAVIGRVENDHPGVFVTIRAKLEAWARRIEAWQRKKWIANVLSATDVDLTTMLGPADVRETLEASIERNVALVSSVSDVTRQRISEAVFRGLTERKPAAGVGKEIREAVDMSRRRALNIAADQLVKLSSALNEERRRQAGITAWAWVSSHKVHYRPAHLARDGKLYTDDSEQVGDEADGHTIAAAPVDRPGMLPFCGCTSRAVVVI
jgi:hypothetical protein